MPLAYADFPTGEVIEGTLTYETSSGYVYIPDYCYDGRNLTGVITWAGGYQYQEILVARTPSTIKRTVEIKNTGNTPIREGRIIVSENLKPYIKAEICDWKGVCGEVAQLREGEELDIVITGDFPADFDQEIKGRLMILEQCTMHNLDLAITRPPAYNLFKKIVLVIKNIIQYFSPP